MLMAVVGGLSLAALFVPAQWLGRITPGHSLVDDGAVALKPGSARPTAPRVTITDIDSFEPEGQILFTTVAIDDQVTVLEWIEAELDDTVELRTHEQVFGARTSTEQRERNLQLMQVSKDTAVVAALEYLGVEAVIESGVGFHDLVEGGPVEGLIEVGEIIVAINDEPVTGLDSLLDLLAAVEPGDPGVLTLENSDSGAVRTQAMTFGAHPDDGREGGFIGIADVTVRAVDAPLPFDLQIDSGAIGGPSAGLAFTLTLIDLLTEGELTGGHKVAVTGTISAGGAVGNIGGVAQKAVGARKAGAEIFIVPVDSVEPAQETAGDLRIVGVSTLQEALDALADIGGDVDGLTLDGHASGDS